MGVLSESVCSTVFEKALCWVMGVLSESVCSTVFEKALCWVMGVLSESVCSTVFEKALCWVMGVLSESVCSTVFEKALCWVMGVLSESVCSTVFEKALCWVMGVLSESVCSTVFEKALCWVMGVLSESVCSTVFEKALCWVMGVLSESVCSTVFEKALCWLVSEKVGGAEGTKLDEDFKELERIRGQVKNPGYPQPEGLLGECMAKFGRELGEETNFGGALLDAGETMKRLAEVKDSLDIDVKQNFIDPLQSLCDKDLREIQHHLKKLEGRRLDYDYKKKRQGKIPDEEVRQALEKFDESKEVAETSMYNLLETDIEQVSQLSSLVEAQLDYHRQAVQVMEDLSQKLKERMEEATTRPKREYTPKPKPVYDYGDTDQSNGDFAYSSSAPSAAMAPSARAPGEETAHTHTRTHTQTHTHTHAHAHAYAHTHTRPHTHTCTHTHPHTRKKHLCVSATLDQPSCKALYDFEPENEGELGFREGDIITLTNQIDENWYEGMLHGQSGFFPLNYVEVLPSCKALYDFEPENEGELGFREGDIITLTNQIDENWYEGMLHGQSGFFPLNYVEVLVPLPH
ncbi:UNVERIFIED_CONTAM: hypothetical protein FKN15_018328 [Acipenser sinensis]